MTPEQRTSAPSTLPSTSDILEVLHDGIACFDANAQLLVCNEQYAKLLAFNIDDIEPGTNWQDLAAQYSGAHPLPEKPSSTDKPIERRLSSANWRRIEWREMADGGFVEICSDISALKTRESLLKRHETVLKTVEELAHIGYFVMNPETLETTFLSDGIMKMAPSLEPSEGQVTYGSLVDRVHPDDKDEVATKTIDAIQNGTSISIEFRTLSVEGEIQHMWLSNAKIFDIDLDQNVRVGLVQDITDRVKNEETSLEREALRKAVTETALDCVITVDSDVLIREFNPAAEHTFGYKKSDVLGKDVYETLIPPHLREGHKAWVAQYLKAGEHNVPRQRIEFEAQHSDGHIFPIELAVTPVEVNQKKFFSAYLRDITERTEAQAELEQAKNQAVRASDAKSEFLAMMSHEIRTPMNGVLGTLSLLEQSSITDDQKSLIRLAASSGEMLNMMLSDMLDFAKIEAGRLDMENVAFRPNLLISDITEFWRPSIEGKSLSFEVLINDQIPEVLLGDTSRIRQILNNFLSNAAKFTDQGTIKVAVSGLPGDAENRGLSISVTDSGRGIAEADRSRVFGAFDQLGSTPHSRDGGTGLGLAICRKLTELMGGAVSFESTLGQGSRFTCDLPLPSCDPNLLPNDNDTPFDELPPIKKKNGEPIRILLAEDNTTNQIVAERLLRNMGANVVTVENGRLATHAVSEDSFDVVLMDINMPIMGGIEATKKIRTQSTNTTQIPIIALTAYAGDTDVSRFQDAGMNGFVAKPIMPRQLHRAITRALSTELPIAKNTQRAPAGKSIIDQDTLADLFSEFDEQAQIRLSHSFITDATRAMNLIRQSLTNEEFDILERQSHILKSIAGTFGALPLQDKAKAINDHCRNEPLPPSTTDIVALIDLIRSSLDQFHSITVNQNGVDK